MFFLSGTVHGNCAKYLYSKSKIANTEQYIGHLKTYFKNLVMKYVDFSEVFGRSQYSSGTYQLVRSLANFNIKEKNLLKEIIKRATNQNDLTIAINRSDHAALSNVAYPEITDHFTMFEYGAFQFVMKDGSIITAYFTSTELSVLNGEDTTKAVNGLLQKYDVNPDKLSLVRYWHTHPEPGPLSIGDDNLGKQLKTIFDKEVEMSAVIKIKGSEDIFVLTSFY